jgi:hypothetical protein
VLVAAAVCPHPPLLVPALAAGAAGELDGLRAACDRAVAALAAAAPDCVVTVGDAPSTGPVPDDACIDWSPYLGAPRPPVGGAALRRLPLSLAIGGWLLDRAGWAGPRSYVGIAADTAPSTCAAIGAALATERGPASGTSGGRLPGDRIADGPRVALLVMGDGSARRGEKAPGYLDPRAVPYDEQVRSALATGDVDALARLDPMEAGELLVAGRASWQALAGAARANGRPVTAELLATAAPYGVAYVVATWHTF